MSNPFYGLLPVNLPYSGATDASGNFRTIQRVRAGFWASVKNVGRIASGNPVWEVGDGAIPLGVGKGQRSEISGLIVPPGASIQIDVIAGTPNATVVGRLVGVQAPDMATIAQAFVGTPNIVATDVSSPRYKLTPTSLGIATVPGNGIARTQSFPLPGGTTGLRLFAINTTPGATITFAVTGDQSGNSYWPGVLTGIPFSTNEPLTVPIDNEQDSSVTISATGSPAGNQWVMSVSALTGAEVIEVRAQRALPVAAPSGSPVLVQTAGLTSVGLQAVALTVNTDFTILAGVAGQTISVHAVHLMTNGSGFTTVELWDGPSATGSLIGVLAQFGAAAGPGPPAMEWDGKGRAGTAGRALVGKPTNVSVGASIWGVVGLIQQ